MFDKEKMKSMRAFFYAVAILIVLAIAFLGGGVFTSFGVLFTVGFLMGWQGKGLKQLIDDYRLGLKVNSIMFSVRAMEEKEKERKQMLEEIRQLRERISAMNVLKEGEAQ